MINMLILSQGYVYLFASLIMDIMVWLIRVDVFCNALLGRLLIIVLIFVWLSVPIIL